MLLEKEKGKFCLGLALSFIERSAVALTSYERELISN